MSSSEINQGNGHAHAPESLTEYEHFLYLSLVMVTEYERRSELDARFVKGMRHERDMVISPSPSSRIRLSL